MRTLLAALVLALSGLAFAQSLQSAKELYARGDFKEAAEIASKLTTAEALAFAAKATSLYAGTQPEREQDGLYSRAEGLARRSIQVGPDAAEGYLELARAQGRLSQLRGVARALLEGYGKLVKDNLDKALELNPRYASAMVALGVWHAEIASRGVGWLYGADGGRVVPYFERAIALEPDTVVHRVEYAKALMLLDKNNKDKARAQLEKALTLRANDAAERLDLERARRELAALD